MLIIQCIMFSVTNDWVCLPVHWRGSGVTMNHYRLAASDNVLVTGSQVLLIITIQRVLILCVTFLDVRFDERSQRAVHFYTEKIKILFEIMNLNLIAPHCIVLVLSKIGLSFLLS